MKRRASKKLKGSGRGLARINKVRKQVTLSEDAVADCKLIGASEKPPRNFSNTLELLIAQEKQRRESELAKAA